jgi:Tfp pilus assembly protein PilV
MKQKVSWPVALLVVGAVVLLLAALYHRATSSGSEARISPQFLQMSPAEQQAALMNAERARRNRGAPPSPAGR